jgi:hypothetical protein
MKEIIFGFSILFSLFSFPSLIAQEAGAERNSPWKSSIHLEGGMIYPEGNIRENIAIRQNISSFYVEQVTSGHIYSEISGLRLGVRWELYQPEWKTGFSAGIRFSHFSSEISGYSSSRADFFYLRYSMVDSDTKFARVKNIYEYNNYFSLPLEFRWVPVEYNNIHLYARVGAELGGLNFLKETDIEFQEESMEEYEADIVDQIDLTRSSLFSTVYGSIGISYQRENRTGYLIELFLPSPFLTHDNFVLTEVDYFSGFRCSVQFPLNTQK